MIQLNGPYRPYRAVQTVVSRMAPHEFVALTSRFPRPHVRLRIVVQRPEVVPSDKTVQLLPIELRRVV